MQSKTDTALIGLSARFYRYQNRLYLENQTISGLKAWQLHFSRIIAFSIVEEQAPPKGWSDAEAAGLAAPEFELVSLPDTYRLRTLRSSRRKAEQILLDCMKRATFRTFAYGGWIGDPGDIAAALARKHGLSHAVWLDRVESQLVVQQSFANIRSRLVAMIKSKIMSRNENRAVSRATLALLHGATVYNHFQKIAKNPQLTEDIHLSADDRIPAAALSQKIATATAGPLRILYCGRADPMKGGHDWVSALGLLKSAGVDLRAIWLGSGSQLGDMQRQARQLGLTEEEVSFPGFLEDRQAIQQNYRNAHVLMFCHKTDESPRNLIESLHAATPIVGFGDPYAEGLVNEEGAGVLVRRGDVDGLAKAITALATDRERLADLIDRAGRSARHLTKEQVFKHRSDLIRHHLGQTP